MNAQISVRVNGCYDIEANKTISQKNRHIKSSVYILEKEIEPNVWLSVRKDFNEYLQNDFSGLTPGLYRAKSSDIDEKGQVLESSLLVSNIVEIKPCEKAGNGAPVLITAIPNPMSDNVELRLEGKLIEGEEVVVKFINLQGVTVKTVEVEDRVYSLSVHDLPKGLYFLELIIDSQKLNRQSIIIQ